MIKCHNTLESLADTKLIILWEQYYVCFMFASLSFDLVYFFFPLRAMQNIQQFTKCPLNILFVHAASFTQTNEKERTNKRQNSLSLSCSFTQRTTHNVFSGNILVLSGVSDWQNSSFCIASNSIRGIQWLICSKFAKKYVDFKGCLFPRCFFFRHILIAMFAESFTLISLCTNQYAPVK